MSSPEDAELRLLMNRKLRELMAKARSKQEPNPRDIVISHLVDRGKEVLEAAEAQYPREARMIIDRLAQLYTSGKLQGDISGGELLYLFKRLGMNVRIETSIKIEEHGKLVDISDRFRLSQED